MFHNKDFHIHSDYHLIATPKQELNPHDKVYDVSLPLNELEEFNHEK